MVNKGRRFARGIRAQYSLSKLHVTAYHLLVMAGPLAIWLWWQKEHQGDF